MNTASTRGQPIDLDESAAGEEDPGASIDLTTPPIKPGGNAPDSTVGSVEDTCPRCGGSGKLAGSACPMCEGKGKVNVALAGV